jgi:hypothetical protein
MPDNENQVSQDPKRWASPTTAQYQVAVDSSTPSILTSLIRCVRAQRRAHRQTLVAPFR